MADTISTMVRGILFIASSQLPPAWVCQVCGAAVLDCAKHAGWHLDLREVLRGAGSPFGPGQLLERI